MPANGTLAKMAAPAKTKGCSLHGSKRFLDPDYPLFLTLARGEWEVSGLRAADLRADWADGNKDDCAARFASARKLGRRGHMVTSLGQYPVRQPDPFRTFLEKN